MLLIWILVTNTGCIILECDYHLQWHKWSNTTLCPALHPLENYWKDWCWSWSSNTLATWNKELTHWKRPWSWERLRAGGEGDDRGWDGWMASPTHWTWLWASPGSWWWAGRPGMLQSMESQRIGSHNWTTKASSKQSKENICVFPLPRWPMAKDKIKYWSILWTEPSEVCNHPLLSCELSKIQNWLSLTSRSELHGSSTAD